MDGINLPVGGYKKEKAESQMNCEWIGCGAGEPLFIVATDKGEQKFCETHYYQFYREHPLSKNPEESRSK